MAREEKHIPFAHPQGQGSPVLDTPTTPPVAREAPHLPEEPFFNPRRKLFIGGVVILLAMAFFMYQAFLSATVYYLTVSELQERGEAIYGETVRVTGKLVPGSFERPSGTIEASFSLAGEEQPLPALYAGAIPDLFFNENSEVVLEGQYGADGVFRADNILVKCPSKYQSAETPS